MWGSVRTGAVECGKLLLSDWHISPPAHPPNYDHLNVKSLLMISIDQLPNFYSCSCLQHPIICNVGLLLISMLLSSVEKNGLHYITLETNDYRTKPQCQDNDIALHRGKLLIFDTYIKMRFFLQILLMTIRFINA